MNSRLHKRNQRTQRPAGLDLVRIEGGRPLAGTVAVSGAKNSALPIMAASLLADGPINLDGVPRLLDVAAMCRVLVQLGSDVRRLKAGPLRVETVDQSPKTAPERMVRRMRASFCVLGPLLAKRRRAVVALPGGCRIGDRPVDLHLRGLAALGADVRIQGGYVAASARKLRGANLCMTGPHGPSVTGTANVLCAAVLAQGKTTIQGAACEPEIVDLGQFLQAMGAEISGLGSSEIQVEGVDSLSGCDYRIIPDRMEAATLLLATAIAGGRVTVTGVVPSHLQSVFDALRRLGCDLWIAEDKVTVARRSPLAPLYVEALPYPGFPTDLQPLLAAVLTQARGHSVIRDRVFPQRFAYVAELRKFGASLQMAGDAVEIAGVLEMSGAKVQASDLRSAAALMLAGLGSHQTTEVRGLRHLDRGYERLDAKLLQLGARLRRGNKPVPAPHLPQE